MGTAFSVIARSVNGVPHHAMPPLSEYEAWIEAEKAASTRPGNAQISAAIYRRVAQLRRLHDSWAEIGRCCGLSGTSAAKIIWQRLPEELR